MLNPRMAARKRRQERVKKKVQGTNERPRLCVYRSLKYIYVQVISDEKGITLASASSLSKELRDKIKKPKSIEAAKEVGRSIAASCKQANIQEVVFDRNGYLYHGRVRAVAEGAREGGLVF